MPNAGPFEESVALNKALDAACTKAGRDPGSIRRSISVRFTTPDETLKNAKAAVDAGFTELLVMTGGGNVPVADPRKRVEELAALLVVGELVPAGACRREHNGRDMRV